MSAWPAGLDGIAAPLAGALWRATWQGGAAILLVWLLCRALPRMPAGVRCWLWRLAVAKLLLAFAWGTPVPLPVPRLPLPAAVPPPAAPEPDVAPAPPVEAVRPAPPARPATPPELRPTPPEALKAIPPSASEPSTLRLVWDLAPQVPALLDAWVWGAARWLCALWGLGVAVQLVSLGAEVRRARRLLRESAPVLAGPLPSLLAELSREMGLSRAPALAMTPHAGSPSVVGLARPALLLPMWVSERWDPADLRLLLAHELSHVKRRDLGWGLLLAAAQLLFFFHPLLPLVRREWRLAQEMACDEAAVVAAGTPAANYGRLLLRVAEECRGAVPGFATAGIAEVYQTFRQRMHALGRRAGWSRRRLLAAAVAVGVLAAAGLVPWRVVAWGEIDPEAVERAALRRTLSGLPSPDAPRTALRVQGKVTDENGAPVAGAAVYVLDGMLLDAGVAAEGRTAADGTYRIEAALARNKGRALPEVLAAHPDHSLGGDLKGTAAATADLPVRLARADAVTGQVFDEAGRAVAGADVAVKMVGVPSGFVSLPPGVRERFSARTDANGWFRIGNLPFRGRAWLKIATPGCADYEQVAETDKKGVRAMPRAAGEIAGNVLDPEGKPLADAVVVAEARGPEPAGQGHPVLTSRFRYTLTDAGGRFRLARVARGNWRVSLDTRASGQLTAVPAQDVAVVPGEAASVVVRVAEGVPLAIRVVEAGTGRPVTRAALRVSDLLPDGKPSRNAFAVATGETGRATGTVRPGRFHVVLQEPLPGWDLFRQRREQVVAVAAGRPAEIAFRLDPLAAVEGVVVDEHGRPVADAVVAPAREAAPGKRNEPSEPRQSATVTDARGRFRIAGIPAGMPVILWAKKGDRETPLPVETRAAAAPERVVLRLRPHDGGTLTGRVIDEEGRPVADVRVGANRDLPAGLERFGHQLLEAGRIEVGSGWVPEGHVLPWSPGSAGSALTDDEGRYVLHDVWAGQRYRLYAMRWEPPELEQVAAPPPQVPAAGRENRGPDIIVTGDGRGRVTVVVRDARTGKPVPDVTVACRPLAPGGGAPAPVALTATNAEGTARIRLRTGRARFWIHAVPQGRKLPAVGVRQDVTINDTWDNRVAFALD